MATLDDSPSLFMGQTWDVWDETVNGGRSEVEAEVPEETYPVTDSMKLQRQDMNLFGFCPSRDEFFLVVCDNCGQVVKPQALQAHIETRHKYSIPKLSPIPTTAASNKSPPASSSTPTRSSTPSSKSSSSGKGPPSEENVSKSRTLDSKAIARSRTSPAKSRKNLRDLKLKKNHSLPVVKVERIPSPLDGTISINNSDKQKARTSPAPRPVTPQVIRTVSPEPVPSPVVRTSSAPASPLIQAVTPVSSPLTHVKAEASPVVEVSPAPSPVTRDSVEETGVTDDVTRVTEVDYTENEERFVVPLSPADVRREVTSSPPPLRQAPSPLPSPASVPPMTTSLTSPLNATSSDVSDTSMTSPVMARPDPRTAAPIPKKTRYTNLPKQEKLLPCKDREYDPDKHCGVWIPDIQKHCTRSLTCKSHALSLRRAVLGRSTDFDTLLDDHRTAKEEILRAKAEANGMPFVPSKAATKSALRKAENERRFTKMNGVALGGHTLDRAATGHHQPVTLGSPLSVTTNLVANASSSVSPPPRLLQKATKLAANNKLHKPVFPPAVFSLPGKESTPPPEVSSRLSSDGEEDSGPYPAAGCSFIKFHPRPAASCKFNARLSGSAIVFNRKQDLLRAAFSQAVDKHLHPPPHKKLCVESKLPRETTATNASKDPYEFIFVHSPHTGANPHHKPAKIPSVVTTATTASLLTANAALLTSATSSSMTVTSSTSTPLTTPIQTTSLLTQNHVTTLLPSKFIVQKSGTAPTVSALKKPINRTIKPKDASINSVAKLITNKRSSTGSSPQPGATVAIAPAVASSTASQPISISIPNALTMNIGTVGSLNTASFTDRSRTSTGAGKPGNLVVDNLANGQFLSLSSMAELQNNLHLHQQQQPLERKKPQPQQQQLKKMGGNSILTCLPSGTFVVENKSQIGGSVVIGGTAGRMSTSSPQHVRPSPTASPLLHTGTISPQILTTSPLSNGIIPSPSSLKNLSYTITTGAPVGGAGAPSPASVESPSPSFAGSAGEDMSPVQHHGMVQHSIVNHSLVGKSRPHKPNSRPPGGATVNQLMQQPLPTNNNTSTSQTQQPPRIISALPSTIYPVARTKMPLGAQHLAAAAAAQKRQKQQQQQPPQTQHVTLPFVTSPGGLVHQQVVDGGEPPLKRARADLRLHHQNSPSNFISQQH